MLQRVPGRGSTQGTQGIRPEPLTRKIPALLHAARCRESRQERVCPTWTTLFMQKKLLS